MSYSAFTTISVSDFLKLTGGAYPPHNKVSYERLPGALYGVSFDGKHYKVSTFNDPNARAFRDRVLEWQITTKKQRLVLSKRK